MNDRDHLDRLLHGFLEGTLTPDETGELNRELERDPAAAERLAELAADHASLHEVFAHPRAPSALKVLRTVRTPASRFVRWAAGALLAAAAVVAAAVVLTGTDEKKPPVERATVARTAGDAYRLRAGESTPLSRGLAIEAGDALQVSAGGTVSLRFGDGVAVTVDGAATLRLDACGAAKAMGLDRGRVTCAVPRQPPGARLRVASPHGTVEVVGTRFTLTAGARSTRLDVDEGRVRFRGSDQKALLVGPGLAAIASADGPARLTTGTLDPRDVILLPRDATLKGDDWSRVADTGASSGVALETQKYPIGETWGYLVSRAVSYASFTFHAERGVTYHIWARGRTLARPRSPEDLSTCAHDAFGLEARTGTFTIRDPYLAPHDVNAVLIDGLSWYTPGRTGWSWMGGPNAPYVEGHLEAAIRFDTTGTHEIRLFALEGPLRVDAIWLSVLRDSRPANDLPVPRP